MLEYQTKSRIALTPIKMPNLDEDNDGNKLLEDLAKVLSKCMSAKSLYSLFSKAAADFGLL